MANLTEKSLINVLISLSVVTAVFNCQDAMAVSFNFQQGYGSIKPFTSGGGFLSGFFAGEDTNNDGKLQCYVLGQECELSGFQALFQGSVVDTSLPGQPVQEFSTIWKFPELLDFEFDFDLATNTLSLGAIADNRVIGGSDFLFIDPNFGGGIDLARYGDFAPSDQLSVTPVPEPATFLGSLVCGSLLLQRKQRNKGKVPRK